MFGYLAYVLLRSHFPYILLNMYQVPPHEGDCC